MIENGTMIKGCSQQLIEKLYEIPQKENLILESNYNKKTNLKMIFGDSNKTGKWTQEEHQRFIEATLFLEMTRKSFRNTLAQGLPNKPDAMHRNSF